MPSETLTPEALTALEQMVKRNPDDAAGYLLDAAPALLAMARRLLDLEGALEFLWNQCDARFDVQTGEEFDLAARNLIRAARAHGWIGLEGKE